MSAGWSGDPRDVTVVIPTLNAGRYIDSVISALKRQDGITPDSVLVVDSGSRDNTVTAFREYGAEVVGLGGRPFNHGGTRRYGTELRPNVPFYVLLTHDAIPAMHDTITSLLASFDDSTVGMAYGRQLPRPDAKGIERHARLYNYPAKGEVRGYRDSARLGVKTTFCSNSFAAYRASALREVGGFPLDSYFAEDQYVAGKMLRAGHRLAYCAEACVVHSHSYTIKDDFRRYFDCGVWHKRDRWLLDEFGEAEGEGLQFVRSEMRYLVRHEPFSVPSAALRTLAKFAGYKLGLREELFSAERKQKLAMQTFYWAQRSS